MIKLMIVDDEESTRSGLKRHIPWKNLGIDSIEEAEDGEQALLLAHSFKPDILLCDIRMPKMNGIDLAYRIKEAFPECRLIFLSGYSDKEYLKSAIILKAAGYIEKPVNPMEVKSVVQAAVDQYLEEQKKKTLEIGLHKRITENLHLTRQNTAMELLNDNLDLSDLKDRLEIAGLDFPLDGQYTTIVLKLEALGQSTATLQEKLVNRAFDALGRKLDSLDVTYLMCFRNMESIILHINERNKAGELSRELAETIREFIGNYLHNECVICIGVGQRVKGVHNICKSYRTALSALKKEFYHGDNKIIFFDSNNNAQYDHDSNLDEQFLRLLLDNRRENARDLVRKLVSEIRRFDCTDINYVRNIFINLAQKLAQAKEERNVNQNEAQAGKLPAEAVLSFRNIFETGDYIISQMDAYFTFIEASSMVSSSVFTIRKFIQDNYNDRNLMIETIADHTYLAPAYMCVLFKRETGKTINQYITEVRIEKARQLLKDHRIKLYEVADMVGYKDANYLAKIFKKAIGMTPSEYRERYLR